MRTTQKKPKILVIVGPTASGKSDLAVELARRFNGEVISADSRQVYRGLDIGTGKITKREMKNVPHHLIDVTSAKRVFTAHDFLIRAEKAIQDIAKRGKLPIIAGGTGFYIDALVGRITLPDVAVNTVLRKKLEKKTVGELFALLKKKDPRRAKDIDFKNPLRLVRALEIVEALGKNPVPQKTSSYETLWIGLQLPREKLYEKITARLHKRIRQGMTAEAKRLHADGLSYKRMERLGLEYRSLARFLQGKITHKEVIAEMDMNSRMYAKRQITYWNRNKNIKWFHSQDMIKIMREVSEWFN